MSYEENMAQLGTNFVTNRYKADDLFYRHDQITPEEVTKQNTIYQKIIETQIKRIAELEAEVANLENKYRPHIRQD